jgi:hypothetical protein
MSRSHVAPFRSSFDGLRTNECVRGILSHPVRAELVDAQHGALR